MSMRMVAARTTADAAAIALNPTRQIPRIKTAGTREPSRTTSANRSQRSLGVRAISHPPSTTVRENVGKRTTS